MCVSILLMDNDNVYFSVYLFRALYHQIHCHIKSIYWSREKFPVRKIIDTYQGKKGYFKKNGMNTFFKALMTSWNVAQRFIKIHRFSLLLLLLHRRIRGVSCEANNQTLSTIKLFCHQYLKRYIFFPSIAAQKKLNMKMLSLPPIIRPPRFHTPLLTFLFKIDIAREKKKKILGNKIKLI